MSPADARELARQIHVITPDTLEPLYEAIREHTDGDPVVYFLAGSGGRKDFNNGIRPHYIRAHDTNAYSVVKLEQPDRYSHYGEVRWVDTPRREALDIIRRHSRLGIKHAVVFDNSVGQEGGKSILGAASYAATFDVYPFDHVYVASTRDASGVSNFTRFPLYVTGENHGPVEYMRKYAPHAARALGDRLSLIDPRVLYEGDLPLPSAHVPGTKFIEQMSSAAGNVFRAIVGAFRKEPDPSLKTYYKRVLRNDDV